LLKEDESKVSLIEPLGKELEEHLSKHDKIIFIGFGT
jgi:hypothetical protein